MRLFSFGKKSNTHGNQLKILFTSDLHGSNVAFKKFLNAGKTYKVDVLIVGGDLAGKALIPIVDLGNGKFDIQGETVGKEGLQEVENSLANKAEPLFHVNRNLFIFVYNKFLLINNDLSRRCGLCPKGWE